MRIDSTLAEKNVSIATEYYKLLYGTEAKKANRAYTGGSTGFIPFKLGITLDGIAGFKIYQKLRINTRFLPTGYPDTSYFIITGINHKLNDHDWETNIDTILIPRFEEFTHIITSDNFTYVQPVKVSPSTPSLVTNNNADNNSTWASKVKQAAEAIFPNLTGGDGDNCAGYTSRLAQALIDIINGQSPKNKESYTGGWGNACDFRFKNEAVNTGKYEIIYESNNLTKAEIINKINTEIHPKAEYGDIIQYFLTNTNNSGDIINSTINQSVDVNGGYVFHTQMFTGDWAKSRSGIGWTSSYPSNYNSSFVYNSRTLKPGNDKFTIYWLRVKDEYRK